MTIHTIDFAEEHGQHACNLPATLAIAAINRGASSDRGLDTTHLLAEIERVKDGSAAPREGSRIDDMSSEPLAEVTKTSHSGLRVTSDPTVNYVPAIDVQSITTTFDNLRSLLFKKGTAHDASWRETLLQYAGDASIILERTGVDMRFFSSQDLTMEDFNQLHQQTIRKTPSKVPSSLVNTPEAFIRNMLMQIDNTGKGRNHGIIINIGVHTFAAGYHHGYYYYFNSVRGRLVYSDKIDEVVMSIAAYFFPGMLMSATPITVIEAPQVDDRKLLGSTSSASSSSSSSSSASSSTSPVASAPVAVSHYDGSMSYKDLYEQKNYVGFIIKLQADLKAIENEPGIGETAVYQALMHVLEGKSLNGVDIHVKGLTRHIRERREKYKKEDPTLWIQSFTQPMGDPTLPMMCETILSKVQAHMRASDLDAHLKSLYEALHSVPYTEPSSAGVSVTPGAASVEDVAILSSALEADGTDEDNAPTQPNAWKTEAEIDSLRIDLGYADANYKAITFHFNSDKTAAYYILPASTLAQKFLPNLWIGNRQAMLGNYTTGTDYNKYDVIVDASLEELGDYDISPQTNHFQISVGDDGTDDLFKALDEQDIFTKIDTARASGQRVLINCRVGQSRSATIAIKYLMWAYHISFVQAYHHLRAHRPEVEPNPGYVKLLLAYEQELGTAIAPIDTIAAKAWLDEYQKDSYQQLRQHLDSPKHCQIVSTGEFVKLKIIPLDNLFIKLVTYLKITGSFFKLGDCQKEYGHIEISAAVYTQLTGKLSSFIAATPSFKTDSTSVSSSQASSSGPSYPAQPSGPRSSYTIVTKLQRYLDNFIRQEGDGILDQIGVGLVDSRFSHLFRKNGRPAGLAAFETLLYKIENITPSKAKRLIQLLDYLNTIVDYLNTVPESAVRCGDSDPVSEDMFLAIKTKAEPLGNDIRGLYQRLKKDMTIAELRAAIQACQQEGLPKESAETIAMPLALFASSTVPNVDATESITFTPA